MMLVQIPLISDHSKFQMGNQRLWRLRRRQQIIDAVLHEAQGRGFTLEFMMNGTPLTRRRCSSRAQAVQVATEKRKDLERAGWATHW
jgi:hypothetical protein